MTFCPFTFETLASHLSISVFSLFSMSILGVLSMSVLGVLSMTILRLTSTKTEQIDSVAVSNSSKKYQELRSLNQPIQRTKAASTLFLLQQGSCILKYDYGTQAQELPQKHYTVLLHKTPTLNKINIARATNYCQQGKYSWMQPSWVIEHKDRALATIVQTSKITMYWWCTRKSTLNGAQ